MIEIDKPPYEYDICSSSIEDTIMNLFKHKPQNFRVFFVVFTPPWRIFERSYEIPSQGHDGVFFVSKDDLPTPNAWDVVMYSCLTGEAVARRQNRPVW